ncbi:MAG TPA: major facilitator superfamily domain-containing protein 6 [Anaerolineales bacterium]|nr:major facilitator superfamily domain-containing protein 6 [Anaerolineales bacterium]
MVFPSTYYFLYYGAISILFPFLALFYQSQGLTGGQIGLLAAISPIVSFFGAPLWTGAADASHRHKLVAMLSIVGVVIVAFIFPSVSSFGGLLLMICLYSFLGSPTGSLVDSAVLTMLGDRKERYGRIRLWGTLGYGAVAPFAGNLIGRLGLKWAFWGYAILLLGSLLVITQIPFRQSHSSGSFRGGLRVLLANQPWVLFLVMVFIAGIGMATINNYLFVYMASLGASKTMMGFALTASTISEIPAMFFSDRMLRRFGARGMLIVAMTTIGLRLLAYSLTTAPWVVLLIQLCHGLTFAAIFTAGVYYADQIAPPGMKATTQGMFNGTLMGFGSAAGGLLGGLLLDHFSPGGMYAFVGTIVLIGLIVFLLVERRLVSKEEAGPGLITDSNASPDRKPVQ